jgi:F0F1-type ATP synthase membrane subunit b/b'
MKAFPSLFNLIIFYVTVVQAIPPPITQFFETSAKKINQGVESILDTLCASCVHEYDLKKQLDENKLDEELLLAHLNAKELALESTSGRKIASIDQVNEMWENKAVDESQLETNLVTFSPDTSSFDSAFSKELDQSLKLAALNAKAVASRATSGRGQATIDQVNNMWNKKFQ